MLSKYMHTSKFDHTLIIYNLLQFQQLLEGNNVVTVFNKHSVHSVCYIIKTNIFISIYIYTIIENEHQMINNKLKQVF